MDTTDYVEGYMVAMELRNTMDLGVADMVPSEYTVDSNASDTVAMERMAVVDIALYVVSSNTAHTVLMERNTMDWNVLDMEKYTVDTGAADMAHLGIDISGWLWLEK